MIQDEFACMVKRKYDRTKDVTVINVIGFLYEMGWLDPERIRRAVIKDFYYQMLKLNNGNAKESRLDCQANYDVSDGYVLHTVYKCNDIK